MSKLSGRLFEPRRPSPPISTAADNVPKPQHSIHRTRNQQASRPQRTLPPRLPITALVPPQRVARFSTLGFRKEPVIRRLTKPTIEANTGTPPPQELEKHCLKGFSNEKHACCWVMSICVSQSSALAGAVWIFHRF